MDVDGLLVLARQFAKVRRKLANNVVADIIEELIKAIEEMRGPLPDGCLPRDKAESWSEGDYAYNIPIVRKTLMELYDRVGMHHENTAEETQDSNIIIAPHSEET